MFDSQCDKKTIKVKDDVYEFLRHVKKVLKDSYDNLKIEQRSRSTDKTFNFMIENGIQQGSVCDELMQLDLSNYSYTDKDKDRPGNVWIFGQMLIIEKDKKVFEIYIKLKLRKNIICLSFHPKEFDIEYPYL